MKALVLLAAAAALAPQAAFGQVSGTWEKTDCAGVRIELPPGLKPKQCENGPVDYVGTCVYENYSKSDPGTFNVHVFVGRNAYCYVGKPQTLEQIRERASAAKNADYTAPQTLPDGSVLSFYRQGRCVLFFKPGHPQMLGFRDVFFGYICKPRGEKIDLAGATALLAGVMSTY